jgi:hypothetical protein
MLLYVLVATHGHSSIVLYDYMIIHVAFYILYASSSINLYCADEGSSFTTFVWRSLYPKGNNASKDEGP